MNKLTAFRKKRLLPLSHIAPVEPLPAATFKSEADPVAAGSCANQTAVVDEALMSHRRKNERGEKVSIWCDQEEKAEERTRLQQHLF